MKLSQWVGLSFLVVPLAYAYAFSFEVGYLLCFRCSLYMVEVTPQRFFAAFAILSLVAMIFLLIHGTGVINFLDFSPHRAIRWIAGLGTFLDGAIQYVRLGW
jgi:hypothetical protein